MWGDMGGDRDMGDMEERELVRERWRIYIRVRERE